MNLKIEQPPPCKQLLGTYKNAGSQAINKSIEGFNWKKSFCSKDFDRQERFFDETIINICHNYIPHKYVTFNDKSPSWLNDNIKFLIERKNATFQNTLKLGSHLPKNLFESPLEKISQSQTLLQKIKIEHISGSAA